MSADNPRRRIPVEVNILKFLVFVLLAIGAMYLVFKNPKNSLYLLVATFPMFNVDTFDIGSGFLVVSPNKIFGALVVVLMVVDVISKGKEFRFFNPHMLLSLLLLALLLISFMVNEARSLSWGQRFLSNLIFLLAMVTWIENRAEADKARLVFIVSLVVFTTIGLLGFGGAAETGATVEARFEASMLNANRAAQAYLIGVGFSLGWLIRNLHIPWRRWAGIAIVMLLAYATMLTGSRAGLIAFLITVSCVPFLLWRVPKGKSVIVPLALAGVALAAFMPQVMSERAKEIPGFGGELSEEEARRSRIHQYRLALQLIDESPIVGIGPNEYNRIYSQRIEGDIRRSLHSWYLKVAVDGGVPALVLFLLLFLATFLAALRLALRGPDPGLRAEGWTFAFLIVGLTVFGTFSSVPYSKLTWLVFTFGALELRLQDVQRKEQQDEAVEAYREQAAELSVVASTVVVIKKD